jgi:hypothetical protein
MGTENEITGLNQRFCMTMFQSAVGCVEPLGSWKFGTPLLAPLVKHSINVSVCILKVTRLIKEIDSYH